MDFPALLDKQIDLVERLVAKSPDLEPIARKYPHETDAFHRRRLQKFFLANFDSVIAAPPPLLNAYFDATFGGEDNADKCWSDFLESPQRCGCPEFSRRCCAAGTTVARKAGDRQQFYATCLRLRWDARCRKSIMLGRRSLSVGFRKSCLAQTKSF